MDVISQGVLTFLINSIWQVALIAGVAEVASRFLRRAPARYLHALWAIALLAALALPIASTRVAVTHLPAVRRANTSSVLTVEAPVVSPTRTVIAERAQPSGLLPEAKAAFRLPGTHRSVPFPPFFARLLLALYFVFIAYELFRLGQAWLRTRQIRVSASVFQFPARVLAAAGQCQPVLGLNSGSKATRILCSPRVSGPVTLGARHPMIILPQTLAASASQDELAAALAHEFAHIARRDYLINLIYEVLFLPISFHPAAVFVKRRVSETRELACDEMATRGINPSAYARALVNLAHHVSHLASTARARPETTLGVFDADILEERIMRLLDKRTRASLPLAKTYLALCCLLLTACCLAASGFTLGVNPGAPAEKAGTVSGIVVDASGARVPQARVWLINRDTEHTRKPTLTDAVGKFSFTGVTDGRYNLEVMKPGLATEFRSFTFHSAAPAPFFPFVLQPGSVQQSVIVTAKAPPGLLAQRSPKSGLPTRIRIGGNVEAAKLIRGAHLEYPEAARSKGV
ncbi:MAG TPA: M56 family metallopeptidase, partial [Terriglobia bacterium]|nr:M56 family metallopeptidase [Terriglobia bacterium]